MSKHIIASWDQPASPIDHESLEKLAQSMKSNDDINSESRVQFCKFFAPHIMIYLRKRNIMGDAALDIMQDTIYRATKNIDSYEKIDGISGFYSWVLTIATNLCNDYYRKHKKTKMFDYSDDIISFDEYLDEIHKIETASKFDLAVEEDMHLKKIYHNDNPKYINAKIILMWFIENKLSDVEKDIVFRHYGMNESLENIAKLHDKNGSAVRKTKERLIPKLKKYLSTDPYIKSLFNE